MTTGRVVWRMLPPTKGGIRFARTAVPSHGGTSVESVVLRLGRRLRLFARHRGVGEFFGKFLFLLCVVTPGCTVFK